MKTKSLLEIFEKAQTVGICSHYSPDGDNLGSMTAFGKYFKNLGKEVTLLQEDHVPESLGFLPYIEEMTSWNGEFFDLLIVTDCADEKRLGPLEKVLEAGEIIVNIDHHQKNSFFGDVNITVPGKSSTCEMVYDLFRSLNIRIDEDMATSLYTGILTDTGNFKFSSTNSNTLKAGAHLLDLGARKEVIIREVFDNAPLKAKMMEAAILEDAEFFKDSKLVLTKVFQKDLEEKDLSMDQFDHVVQYYRGTEEVYVSALFKERKKGFKISLRSSKIPVNELAEKFGGGGHIYAAGCFIPGDFNQVKTEFVETFEKWFDERNFNC